MSGRNPWPSPFENDERAPAKPQTKAPARIDGGAAVIRKGEPPKGPLYTQEQVDRLVLPLVDALGRIEAHVSHAKVRRAHASLDRLEARLEALARENAELREREEAVRRVVDRYDFEVKHSTSEGDVRDAAYAAIRDIEAALSRTGAARTTGGDDGED